MFPSKYIFSSKGKYITVVLKDGSLVSGVLTDCDNWSNLVLTAATSQNLGSDKETLYETTMIRGNMIQTIYLPKDLAETVKNTRDQNKPKHYHQNPQQNQQQNRQDRNQGGYQNRNQGGDYQNRGYQNRNQGYQNRNQGGYQNRNQGGNYQNRGNYRNQGGYQNRNQGGYQNRNQGGDHQNRDHN